MTSGDRADVNTSSDRCDCRRSDGRWGANVYDRRAALGVTSPTPTLDTAIVYPSGASRGPSVGVADPRPFELVGAPWIDGERLAEAMNARNLPGIQFRPAFFEPTFQKHAKTSCGGCQVHVLDRQAFRPLRTSVELIEEFHRQDPGRFAWRQPPYEYSTTRCRSTSSMVRRARSAIAAEGLRAREQWGTHRRSFRGCAAILALLRFASLLARAGAAVPLLIRWKPATGN